MQPEPDTIINPTDSVKKDLQESGTDNDLLQTSPIGGDMDDLLGNGVPPEATSGEPNPNDDIGNEQLDQTIPTPSPFSKS